MFPYEVMEERQDALERLELCIRWGYYDIHVLRFHLTQFPPGKILNFHKHAEFEFHFIPRGKGTVILVDEPYSLRAGQFYLTGPDVLHYQEADPHEAMDELCLHVDFVDRRIGQADGSPPEEIDQWEIAEADDCINKLRALPLFPTFDVHQAMPLFLQAYEACSSNFTGSYTTIKQNVIQILLRAVRAYDTVKAQEQPQLPTRDMKAYRYRLALEYMHANYAGIVTLEDIADKLNLSSRHIQRIFKQAGDGRSFSETLEEIRLKAVCRTLDESTQPIEKIAKITGFANGNYLHAVFRKKFRMTPSEYRLRQAISLTN